MDRLEPASLLLIAPAVLFWPKPGAVLLLIVPATWLFRRAVTGHFVHRTPLDGPILLLLVMAAASLGVSAVPDLTFPRVLSLVLGMAVFYTVVGHARQERGLLTAAAVYLLLGVGIAGVGILGTEWISKFALLDAVVRRLPAALRGLPGAETGFHPNEVAGTLLWFLPVQVALLACWVTGRWDGQYKRPAGILLFASTGLTLLALVLTQSRGGWMGALAAVLVLFALTGRRNALIAGAAGIAVVIVLVVVGPNQVMEFLSDDALQAGEGALRFPFRLEMWRGALRGMVDFPFTGMGLGAFRQVAPLLYPLDIPPDYPFTHAHNHLLHTAVELGIPGLIAYVALWLLAAWMVVQAYRNARGWRRALAAGLGGALVAYFVYGVTDTVALGAKPGVAFWCMLGLVAVLPRSATQPLEQAR
jgi:putative inorganic carbon (HCO3(-)) transporter